MECLYKKRGALISVEVIIAPLYVIHYQPTNYDKGIFL
jgi:hypothetical protein